MIYLWILAPLVRPYLWPVGISFGDHLPFISFISSRKPSVKIMEATSQSLLSWLVLWGDTWIMCSVSSKIEEFTHFVCCTLGVKINSKVRGAFGCSGELLSSLSLLFSPPVARYNRAQTVGMGAVCKHVDWRPEYFKKRVIFTPGSVWKAKRTSSLLGNSHPRARRR